MGIPSATPDHATQGAQPVMLDAHDLPAFCPNNTTFTSASAMKSAPWRSVSQPFSSIACS